MTDPNDHRDDSLSDKMITFRTITAMLETLQDPSFDISLSMGKASLTASLPGQCPVTVQNQDERHSLGALATLLVRHHGFTAVTLKEPSTPDSPTMELVVCSHGQDQGFTPIVSDSCTRNDSSSALGYSGDKISISHPDASSIDPSDPLPYVRETWTSQSFQSHAAAVIKLLTAADQNSGDTLGIFTYVAAKDYQKMLWMWQHEDCSKPFYKCLLDVPPSRAKAGRRPFPVPQSITTFSGRRDADFLESLSQPLNEYFLKLSKLGIPNLMKLAVEYTTDSDLPPIYTVNTCEEVHRLLCHLLRCYDRSLLALDKFTGTPLSDKKMEDFEAAVHCFTTCALMLRDFAYSSIFAEHISRIQPVDPRARRLDGWIDAEEGEEVLDSELVGDAYANWLRSRVVYFEATNNLIGIASQFRGVSLKILTIQHAEVTLRSWREVVAEVLSSSSPSGSSSCSLQDAILAIEKVISRNISFGKQLKLLGKNFHGMPHCEAFLASLIHRSNSLEAHDMDGFTNLNPIFAVSDRCCATCSHLLSLLGIPEPLQFHGQDSHQEVIACNLPPYLPAPIIDSMITHFGAKLNVVIQKLYSATQSESWQQNDSRVASTTTKFPFFSDFLNRICRYLT